MTLCSFRVFNPDWRITLYTSPIGEKHWSTGEDQDQFNYHGEDWRERLDELGVEVRHYDAPLVSANSVADICRWQVLSEGGTFADMDIVFTKPMPDLPATNALTCENGFLYLGLTHSPGGRLFTDIYAEALNQPTGGYQSSGVDAAYRYAFGHADYSGVHMQPTLQILSEKSGEEVYNIPKHLIHPLTHYEVWSTDYEYGEAGDVVGVHWFAGCPAGQSASCGYRPDNIERGTVARAALRSWNLYQGGNLG